MNGRMSALDSGESYLMPCLIDMDFNRRLAVCVSEKADGRVQ